ncbi:unnamed protein product [Colletotrichum tofieldiae]|nr:unnamed protein product [Colletotrichum tofieldiae]
MATQTFETNGVRIAVEGCGHGTLNAIYAAVAASCEARGWDGVDILIIGGDFQAARNAADLTVMSVPAKYRELGDFWEYYAGHRTAPYLTVFAGGNHEAASHMWELFYGGWAAPNIYYLGAANVLRLGPLRIAGMSGIWKGFDYRKAHHERLPMGLDEIKSFYHVREVDVRKLLLLREQVDVGISHDWPRAIERWGDEKALWRMKPDFERESKDGTLGNVAAEYVNFLALDKCLPRRHFLQLLEAHPHNVLPADQPSPTRPFRLQYDPEWLAITRVFHTSLKIGDPSAQPSPNLGEEHYVPLVDAERRWVEENVVKKDRLDVPLNFEITAPPHVEGEPESVPHQPFEYTNPQTSAFCELLEVENLWDASEEERMERKAKGPPAGEFRGHRGGEGVDEVDEVVEVVEDGVEGVEAEAKVGIDINHVGFS